MTPSTQGDEPSVVGCARNRHGAHAEEEDPVSWFDYEETRIYFEEEGTGDPVLFLRAGRRASMSSRTSAAPWHGTSA